MTDTGNGLFKCQSDIKADGSLADRTCKMKGIKMIHRLPTPECRIAAKKGVYVICKKRRRYRLMD